MNIAIIGGGITGLTAAYELTKKGHHVTVFEKEKTLGGLAHGFKPASPSQGGPASPRPGSTRGGKSNWNWHLESAYHHLFTNDTAILGLIKELELTDKLILTRPVTANFMSSSVIPGLTRDPSSLLNTGFRLDGRNDNAILPFDSPTHLLTYPGLSILDKFRTGLLIIFIKLNPFWQPLERITAKKLFTAIGGPTSWHLLWEPLMIGKFGKYADSICASWLWARIKKRTQKLYYIEGGFHTLVSALEKAIKRRGGKIFTGTSVDNVHRSHSLASLRLRSGSFIIHSPRFSSGEAGHSSFDRVLLTIPTPIASKLLSSCQLSTARLAQAPAKRVNGQLSSSIPHLHAQTLILETKEPILQGTTLRGCKVVPCEANGIYWLNIMDRSFPFLAVVAHTNMIDPKYYAGHHLTYFGNYLPDGHKYLSMTTKELYREFLPFIQRIRTTSNFKIQTSNLKMKSLQFKVLSLHLFTAPFAQPVHELHYSRRAPKLTTPIAGIFFANIDSIYPWDRGTNYAVELGQKAANVICHSRAGGNP